MYRVVITPEQFIASCIFDEWWDAHTKEIGLWHTDRGIEERMKVERHTLDLMTGARHVSGIGYTFDHRGTAFAFALTYCV